MPTYHSDNMECAVYYMYIYGYVSTCSTVLFRPTCLIVAFVGLLPVLLLLLLLLLVGAAGKLFVGTDPTMVVVLVETVGHEENGNVQNGRPLRVACIRGRVRK